MSVSEVVSRLRILVVVGEFPLLSETFVLDQVTALIDRGFDVRILAGGARIEAATHPDVVAYGLIGRTSYANANTFGRGFLDGMRLFFGEISSGRLGLVWESLRLTLARKFGRLTVTEPRTLLAFGRALAAIEAPDVALCHFGPQGDLMVRLRRAFGGRWKVATFFHGHDLSTLPVELDGQIYDELFRTGDIFFPVSEFFRRRLIELGAEERRAVVQRMAVQFDPKMRITDDPLVTNESPFTFVSVGRLVEKKGHEFTIRAFAECVSRTPATELQLVVVGDGPLRVYLRELIESLRLGDRVRMAGALQREEVRQHLLAAHCFVLASVTAANGDMEGIPVAIPEAMSLGLPVISTFHSGIPEVVENELSGLLVRERDVVGLADAMFRLVCDRGATRLMGEYARSKVERAVNRERWNDLLAERVREMARCSGNPL